MTAPTATINVDPSVYYDAATIINKAGAAYFSVFQTQLGVLQDTKEMSGTVGDCAEWGKSYDQKADSAYGLISNLLAAIDSYTTILIDAGYNHAVADYPPDSGGLAPTKPATPPPAMSVCPLMPASAGGKGNGLIDDGLDLVAKIGVPVPDGDTGKLLKAAGAWTEMATSDAAIKLSSELERAAALFQTVTAPEVEFISGDIRSMKDAAADVTATCKDIAKACQDQKTAHDNLREDLKHTLEDFRDELIKELAINAVVSVALSFVTFGVGAAVGIARTAKCLEKFAKLLRKVLDLRKINKAVSVEKETEQTRAELQRIADLLGKRANDLKQAAERAKAKLGSTMEKYLRPNELETAKRLADDPKFAGRTFESPPPPDPGYDWYDDLGRKYDALGRGDKSEFHNFEKFKDSIDHHLVKQGNDFTVIDMTGYTPQQIAEVRGYVDSLPPSSQQKIIRMGF
ncbi:hypothetical protein ACFV4K_24565 [Nocardia sp. NPDC059764]|uniref:hypothetical protein n=1 Tax=Nocardia sp. NPDC059764 TaxID=3346939 RepID=UPI00364A7D98